MKRTIGVFLTLLSFASTTSAAVNWSINSFNLQDWLSVMTVLTAVAVLIAFWMKRKPASGRW